MKLGSSALVGAALAMAVAPAFAADLGGPVSFKDGPVAADALAVTGYVQVTNDYIFRGVSQNNREATGQGGVDATYGMFYAGTFFSGVDFQGQPGASAVERANYELDLYAGIKPKLGEVTFDFGVIGYTYPDTTRVVAGTYAATYVELKAGASITVLKDLALGGTVYVSPDYFGETGSAVTIEGTASKPITSFKGIDFAASGTVGHTFYSDAMSHGIANYDYTYGNLGLTATYKTVSVDLRWWDTDLPGKVCDGASVFQCGSAFAATLKVTY